jgi:hypothetical protein
MNPKAIAAWILGGGVGITILGFAMQFWISLVVAGQLANAGIVPESRFAAAEEDIQDNTDDIERGDNKIERIAQILMED